MNSDRLLILGGGPFCLIISGFLAKKYQTVNLWLPDPAFARELEETRTARIRSEPYRISDNVEIMHNLDELQQGSWIVLYITPSRQFEDIAEKVMNTLSPGEKHMIGIMTKGLLRKTTRRRHGISLVTDFIHFLAAKRNFTDYSVSFISGPSLLAEIYSHHYSFFQIGSSDEKAARQVSEILTDEHIKGFYTDDIIGVELGGSLKNPVAIAAGMAELIPHCGSNFTGMVISEGYKEIRKFALAFGAREETLAGLAGLGDLISTSISPNSRNRSFGMQFSRRLLHDPETSFLEKIETFLRPTTVIEKEALASMENVEGAFILEPMLEIAEERNIDLPFFHLIYDILSRRKHPEELATYFGGAPMEKQESLDSYLNMATTAGSEFTKFLVKRIYQQISNMRSMHERIEKQAALILKMLDRRLKENEAKGRENMVQEIKMEMELWGKLNRKEDDSREVLEQLISYYTEEISDHFTPSVRAALIRIIGPVRFVLGGFKAGSALPVMGGNIDELKKLSKRYNILYVPTHRTHLDSMEVAFGLTWAGLPAPRYAAASSLMGKPMIKKILKGLGAFSVDRERTRNILYLECLTGYSVMMLESGIPSLVYPEGTRSRTGKICDIKTGLLTTALEAYKRSGSEILIVPLALSYENVPEDEEFTDLKSKSELKDYLFKRTRCFLEICDPIRISHLIHSDEPGTVLGAEIESAWRRHIKVIPNQLLARILKENDYELRMESAEFLIQDFMETHRANYLETSAEKVLKEGINALKKRGIISVNVDKIKTENRTLLDYYGNMVPVPEDL